MRLDIAQDRSLDAAVGEIKADVMARRDIFAIVSSASIAVLDLSGRKLYRPGIAVRGKPINHGASGIAETEKLRHFVESLACSIVPGVANVFVGPGVALQGGEVEMSVSAGNHKREHREPDFVVSLLPFFEQDRVDVTFQMVNGDQGFIEGERHGLRIADAYQQGSGQAGALSDSDGVDRIVAVTGLSQRLAHHG